MTGSMKGFHVEYRSEDDGKEIADLLMKRRIVGHGLAGFNDELVVKILNTEVDATEKDMDGKRYFKRYNTIFHIIDSTVRVYLVYEVYNPKLSLDHKKQKIYWASTLIEIMGATEEKVNESKSMFEERVGIILKNPVDLKIQLEIKKH